jgi:TolB-like protein/DNA-binding winged helix-turn-helix (wHTH) protein/Flp pilus assembly protein TadD
MAAEPQPARVLRFGVFEADLGNRQFFRNGVSVSLTGQPFEILALLLEHPGQLVTREQLRTRLWPSGTVVEFDHSIAAAITKLREVLGDDAQNPRFIATVPRHGYRFIAPVSSTAPTPTETLLIRTHPPELPVSAQAMRRRGRRLYRALIALFTVVAVATALIFVAKFWISKHAPASPPAASAVPSIAVLPFTDMSEAKDQEYFADGLAEEFIDLLAKTPGLDVIARTSSFSFKGKADDIPTIAGKLKVANILEGSVRRSGNRVRISTQLVRAADGHHLWSETYDREMKDIFTVQDEIAAAVVRALKLKLTAGQEPSRDEAAKIELGGTRNPDAFDAYLRGSKAYDLGQGASGYQAAIAAYTEAIRLDPNYALAFAGRSRVLSYYAAGYVSESALREFYDKAQADARQALKLAPELAEGHLALANYLHRGLLDFAGASDEYERAMRLAPGSAQILAEGGNFAAIMGRFDTGLSAGRRAVVLDPLSPRRRALLGEALYVARRYDEAVAAYGEVISLEPEFKSAYGFRGLAYYGLGDLQRARSSCESTDHWTCQLCRAITYDKLGRHADAETVFKNFQAQFGDAAAYQYATIYAQRGNPTLALSWLTIAIKAGDAGVGYVKFDPLMDPLRKEPRFQAIERELKFPQMDAPPCARPSCDGRSQGRLQP